ncbi:hypothetical protein P7C70_g585, partial [Phenoliferia sp. Uapishka_3]
MTHRACSRWINSTSFLSLPDRPVFLILPHSLLSLFLYPSSTVFSAAKTSYQHLIDGRDHAATPSFLPTSMVAQAQALHQVLVTRNLQYFKPTPSPIAALQSRFFQLLSSPKSSSSRLREAFTCTLSTEAERDAEAELEELFQGPPQIALVQGNVDPSRLLDKAERPTVGYASTTGSAICVSAGCPPPGAPTKRVRQVGVFCLLQAQLTSVNREAQVGISQQLLKESKSHYHAPSLSPSPTVTPTARLALHTMSYPQQGYPSQQQQLAQQQAAYGAGAQRGGPGGQPAPFRGGAYAGAGGAQPQMRGTPQQQAQQQQQQQAGKSEYMSDGNEGLLRAIKYVQPAHSGRVYSPTHLTFPPSASSFLPNRRRKPTDRSLPSFALPSASTSKQSPTEAKLEESTKSLQSMVESYKRLQAVERKLDWNVSRRKVELTEAVTGQRYAGIKRTLRVHLTTKLIDQPWQAPLADLTAPPASDAVPTPTPSATTPPIIPATTSPSNPLDISVGGEPSSFTGAEDSSKMDVEPSADGLFSGTATPGDKESIEPSLLEPVPEPTPVLPPDFVTGTGIPRFEMTVTGELLPAVGSGETESESEGWTKYIKRMVVDFPDREVATFDRTGPIDWNRPPNSTPSALTFSLPTSTPTSVRISLYIAHRTDYFALMPEVAMMLDMAEGDRVSVLQALWGYVRMHGLVDDASKHVRCDQRMKKLFSGQDKVPFHHLPEYVMRFLIPPHPTVLDYMVKTDASIGEVAHTAFDIQISANDPAQAEMERVHHALSTPDARLKEIAILDEKIAAEAVAIKQTHLKRSFLTAFASSPQEFLSRWVASQASDLDVILPGGSASKDEMRRSEKWQGDWVKEGATVHAIRATEGMLREAKGGAQQAAFAQQQQQQMYARR